MVETDKKLLLVTARIDIYKMQYESPEKKNTPVLVRPYIQVGWSKFERIFVSFPNIQGGDSVGYRKSSLEGRNRLKKKEVLKGTKSSAHGKNVRWWFYGV